MAKTRFTQRQKRRRIANNNGPVVKFCDEKLEDRISQLSDEILILILSLLTVKDAVLTSVLSQRWRSLWKSITNLNFDASEKLAKLCLRQEFCEIERPRYVNWVDSVLNAHDSTIVEGFRIEFDLDSSFESTIDRWIEFAAERRVQRLELDLFKPGICPRISSECYTFLRSHVDQSRESFMNQSCSEFPAVQPSKIVRFKFLKALSLKCVSVTGDTIDYLLSNCPLLEQLFVEASATLVELTIQGASLQLKHLWIKFCKTLQVIKIRDTNLVSFNYLGHRISLYLQNVPMLVDLSVGGYDPGFVTSVFGCNMLCLPLLESLTLDIFFIEVGIEFYAFPVLSKLKKLVLRVWAWEDDCLLRYTSLIRASPCLENFIFQLRRTRCFRSRGYLRRGVDFPHPSLRVVELAGYSGCSIDLEVALYFLWNAVALEKLIIDPHCQCRLAHLEKESLENFVTAIRADEEASRSEAKKQFQGIIPPGVQLEIR